MLRKEITLVCEGCECYFNTLSKRGPQRRFCDDCRKRRAKIHARAQAQKPRKPPRCRIVHPQG